MLTWNMPTVIIDLFKMARPSHYIKNIFVMPGIFFTFLLVEDRYQKDLSIADIILGIISISIASSANYVLNEFLDRNSDSFHKIKKTRPAASGRVTFSQSMLFYISLSLLSLFIAYKFGPYFTSVIFLFLISGALYNIKPFRLKDVYLIDVIAESFNNVIRLLAGWFLLIERYYPPLSLVVTYWLIGAFLMSAKRMAEIQSFSSRTIAILYRNSFNSYTVEKLRSITFLYAGLSLSSLTVFSIKWEPQSIILIPLSALIFTYYFHMSNGINSPASRPESLWRDWKLNLMLILFILGTLLVLTANLTVFSDFVSSGLIIVK